MVDEKKARAQGDVIEFIGASQPGRYRSQPPALLRRVGPRTQGFCALTATKGWFMPCIFTNIRIGILIASFSAVLTAQVPQQVRASIDHILGGQGVYIPDDQVYKVVLPRAEATILYDYQTFHQILG
jgi:hypothetical protein